MYTYMYTCMHVNTHVNYLSYILHVNVHAYTCTIMHIQYVHVYCTCTMYMYVRLHRKMRYMYTCTCTPTHNTLFSNWVLIHWATEMAQMARALIQHVYTVQGKDKYTETPVLSTEVQGRLIKPSIMWNTILSYMYMYMYTCTTYSALAARAIN